MRIDLNAHLVSYRAVRSETKFRETKASDPPTR
jgi:hypothetical protein